MATNEPVVGTLAALEAAAFHLRAVRFSREATPNDIREADLALIDAALRHTGATEAGRLAGLLKQERERCARLLSAEAEQAEERFHAENGPGWRDHLTQYQDGFTDGLWAAVEMVLRLEPPAA